MPGRGLFQYKVMSFGLHSAQASLQMVLDTINGPKMKPDGFAYLDDITVIARMHGKHIRNLIELFRRLNLRYWRYVGEIVIHTECGKTTISEMPAPENVKPFEDFLEWRHGTEAFYCNNTPQEKRSILDRETKDSLRVIEVYAYTFNQIFYLQTDISDIGLGTI